MTRFKRHSRLAAHMSDQYQRNHRNNKEPDGISDRLVINFHFFHQRRIKRVPRDTSSTSRQPATTTTATARDETKRKEASNNKVGEREKMDPKAIRRSYIFKYLSSSGEALRVEETTAGATLLAFYNRLPHRKKNWTDREMGHSTKPSKHEIKRRGRPQPRRKKTAKKVRFSTKTAALKPKTKHRDEDGKGKVNPLIPFSFLRKAR